MAAQNGVIGDDPTAMPQTVVDEQQLTVERNMATFSQSKEYRALKEHIDTRIVFYQSYLPDGRPVEERPTIDNWVIANAVIGEFKAILAAYELARKTVEEHDAR